MKSLLLLLILSSLVLQACHNVEDKSTQLIDANKRMAAANYNIQLGMGYLKQGDNPRAKHKLLTALKLNPHSAEAHSAMAYFLEKTGDTDTAGKYYSKALSLAPKSGSQLNTYGAFLCRMGQYAEAENYFLKAVKDVNYLNTAAAYENAGLCAAAIPNENKAELYFLKALMQDSRRAPSLYELVLLKLKQNQANSALRYLQKYSALTFANQDLLKLGLLAAARAKRLDLETEYNMYINRQNSGVNNEHNNRG